MFECSLLGAIGVRKHSVDADSGKLAALLPCVENETLRTTINPGILIVHEDVLVRHVLSAALIRENYFVIAAVDRSEAELLISSFRDQIRLLIVSEACMCAPSLCRFDQPCLVITEETRKTLGGVARRGAAAAPVVPEKVMDKVRAALQSLPNHPESI